MLSVERKSNEIGNAESDAIGRFLERHYSTIFHEEAFNTIVAGVFKTDFSYCLVFGKNNALTALCPYHSYRQGLMRITHSNPTIYEVPYGGWVYDDEIHDIADLLPLKRAAINEVIFYWSTPGNGRDMPDAAGRRTAFKTSFVDLGESEDSIWQSVINGKRRNMIRKASKAGVHADFLGADRFGAFHELLTQTYAAAHLIPKPSTFYERVMKTYEPMGRAVIIAARYQNEVIAAVMLVRNSLICHYWLGASRASAENLGQGELLQWEAIKWAKKCGCKYYDLCVIEEERLPNIARFKLGFSQHIVPFYCITQGGAVYRLIAKARSWR
jgi:hypothetical protein